MLIDKGKLIALLVDKTGRSKQEVEKQLNQLTEHIKQAGKSGRQFHIEGFGTFGMEDGTMYFDPASQLKTEINQKYAGMKPIELMAAFKESGAGVPVEEAKDKLVAPEPKKADEEVPEIVEESEKEQPELTEEVAGKKTENKQKEAPVPASTTSSKKEKQPVKEKAAVGKDKEESDPLGTVLIAAVVVIGLLVGGWLVYDSGILNISGSKSSLGGVPADTTAQNTDQPMPTASDSTFVSGLGADTTEQNATDDVSGNSDSKTRAESAPYGLKGTANERAENAYTIVIHSFRLRSTVQEIADSLDQRGYRTVLFNGSANSESRWRLGLGQFKSIPDAQDAVQQLSESYKKNHFITRIQ